MAYDTAPVLTDGLLASVQVSLPAITAAVERFAEFATAANALEDEAIALRDDATRIQPPITVEEDLTVQRQLQAVIAKTKEKEAFWQVTKTVNDLHKALTKKRGVAEAALDAARTRLNGLHNDFVNAAAQRAREEAERLLRAAEDDAKAKQQAELDALEAEALAAEDAAPDLSEREARFVAEVVDGGADYQAAARLAGYANPAAQAARMKGSAKVQAAIEAAKKAQAAREQAAAVKAQGLVVEAPRNLPEAVVASSGLKRRETWVGEVTDEAAFIAAALGGKFKIPASCLKIDQSGLNECAKALQTRMRWPGVRAVKRTTNF